MDGLSQSISDLIRLAIEPIAPLFSAVQPYCEAHPLLTLALAAIGCVFAVSRESKSAV